jgi:hypothetical protein
MVLREVDVKGLQTADPVGGEGEDFGEHEGDAASTTVLWDVTGSLPLLVIVEHA